MEKNNNFETLEEPSKKLRKKDDYSISVFDPYKRYIHEIKNIPILSKEEERRLALIYYKKGDKDAAYKLIVSNLRLVIKIAMEFYKTWMKNLSDIVQEGNIGLIEALKRYNPYKNVRFSSYASFWIKAYIIKFIMDNYSIIRIGKTQAQRKLFFNLNKEKKRLEKLGYDVGPKLLAERLDVKEEEITEMEQRLGTPILSLDEPMNDESRARYIDYMTYDQEPLDERLAEDEMQNIFKKKLNLFKDTLNPKERYIFENRVYTDTPENLREIGEALDFSRERARQIEANVLRKLKVFLKENMPEIDPEKIF